jgi:glycosyltransferase involved in cell wall biosynthesis
MAQTKPAVTIIMRTRERPALLRRALADVCAQTSDDWQLVVVNDGGDPAEVEKLVAERDRLTERTTVLHNGESRGMEAASNQALAAGDSADSSTYIAIHDDDDTWDPSFLARTMAHLDETGDAAVAVRTEIVWERIEGTDIHEESREAFWPDLHWFSLFDLIRINRTVPISVLYRRDVHDEVGLFREDLAAVGDWEFHLRLATSSRSLGFIDGLPLAFWHKRRDAEGSLANSVVDRWDDHERLDLVVREGALRDHARTHGLGGLLYLTKYFQREIDQIHDRITYGEERLHEVLDLLRRSEERAAQQGELLARQAEVVARQDEWFRRQEDRMLALEQAISDASLVSLVRRRYRRLKTRLTGS